MKRHGDSATIKTTHVLPPIPDRRFDYSAHYDDVGEEDSALWSHPIMRGHRKEPKATATIRHQKHLLDTTAIALEGIVAYLRALQPNPTRVRESICLKLAEDALARIKAETQQ